MVSKIHREVENFEKQNLPIILIGHHNHPEVIGTMGQIKSSIHLVENEKDVELLKLDNNNRLSEIARMLSGDKLNNEAIANAKKMLDIW